MPGPGCGDLNTAGAKIAFNRVPERRDFDELMEQLLAASAPLTEETGLVETD